MAAMPAVVMPALVPSPDVTLDGKGSLLYKLESNESGCACKGVKGCGWITEVRSPSVLASHLTHWLNIRMDILGLDN